MDWGFNPQPKGQSRLDVKDAKAKAEASDLDLAKADCWTRDKGRCRCCGRKVIKSVALVPNRGEVHHLTARSKVKALLTSVWNLVLLDAKCHQRVTGKVNDRLFVVQKAADMRTLDGVSYVNADKPLTFEEMAK